MIGGIASGALSKGRRPDQSAYNYNHQNDWTQANGWDSRQGVVDDRYGNVYDQAMAEARGEAGPSVAEQQLRAGQSRAAADAAQAAASARGGPAMSALAQRQAQEQGNQGQLSVNRDAGILRAQERESALSRALAANGGAASNASNARGASIGQQQADMQAARYQQEGAMAYDQAMRQADEADRARKQKFWGQLTSAGTSMGTMGVSGMMSGQGGGGGGPAPSGYEGNPYRGFTDGSGGY